MNLSLRLTKIASFVDKGANLLDVGTDHAYIPIHLCKNNIINKAIASDVSQGPVFNARNNVKNYNLLDRIEVRQGDGLKSVSLEDCLDTCIIAGMGGSLIVKILQDSKELVDKFSTLILQPQKSVDKVRKYLHKINFKIVNDEMFKDDGKIYTLLVAKKGYEKPYSENEYLFGKFEIDRKDIVLKEYIFKELHKMEKIIFQIKKNEASYTNLQEKYLIYKEIYECL